MGPPSHMQSVIGQNVMWHVTVTLRRKDYLKEEEKSQRNNYTNGWLLRTAINTRRQSVIHGEKQPPR